jgi:HSP20 family protein
MLNTFFANDIRQTLDHFRRSVDSLFDSFNGAPAENRTSGEWTFSPAVESGWSDDKLFLRAILPGVSEKDLKVSVQNNQLVIEGERKAPEGWAGVNFQQLMYGRFYASVPLPSGLDLDKVSCRLHDGVLDIMIPVSEQMKPRMIPIETGEERKAIAA